jgi:hypothetical protein
MADASWDQTLWMSILSSKASWSRSDHAPENSLGEDPNWILVELFHLLLQDPPVPKLSYTFALTHAADGPCIAIIECALQ